MRIYNRSTLIAFWTIHPDAAPSLRAWADEAEQADWKDPSDIRAKYVTASIVGTDRVVFNIRGNYYRLIVQIRYQFKCIYVRFIGTHAEYDRIDAATI